MDKIELQVGIAVEQSQLGPTIRSSHILTAHYNFNCLYHSV